jgi:Fibronectin type III-like domain/Glycosyl hydrolase family 3 C-terminal domain
VGDGGDRWPSRWAQSRRLHETAPPPESLAGPAQTYSAAVRLTAGHTYSLRINSTSSALGWATPSALAPGIARAAAAAKSAAAAVVVVSDDTETEAAEGPSLTLPSAQNELISAVAAANPRTVVVIDAGAPVTMPWLRRVAAVVAEPPRQLKGFQKVSMAPGQSTTVSFHLSSHGLSYWNSKWVVPDGRFRVHVGDSSALASLPLRGGFTVAGR